MRLSLVTITALLSGALATASALAEPIAAYTGQTIQTFSRTETGKVALSETPQTWSGSEAYPGVDPSSAGTTYSYNIFILNYVNFYPDAYVEILFDDTADSGSLFLRAYAGSYNPADKQQNWLGDIGVASNHNGGQNLTLDVYLPFKQSLVLVASTTGAAPAGISDPFNIYVNGYTDTARHDAPVTGKVPTSLTPEPSTFALLGTGVLGIAGVLRRRFV